MGIKSHIFGQRGHRAARVGMAIVAAFYLVAIFADFLAPYPYSDQARQEPSAPPSVIRFRDDDGKWHLRPFIYKQKLVDPLNLIYGDDSSRPYQLELLSRGSPHTLFGFIATDIHLFGIAVSDSSSPPRINLLGTDQLGRDRFSRLLFAIRFSLLVSPIGTALAALIGVIIGSLSGYTTRTVDTVVMGVTDTVISLPTLILVLAARAAFPLELPPLTAAFLLISLFALTGWAEMARLTRGLVIATRNREFVLAARATGVRERRILWRHVLPNIASPILTQATLMLPVFLLAEVALSFLGVGLQEPEPSLGNMLSTAADMSQVGGSPMILLSPAIAIFVFVLAIRLVGMQKDGPTALQK